MEIPKECALCPRACGANRSSGVGPCAGGSVPRVALAAPHHWEEPCISGTGGSGTVFFSGCSLGCVFCQNHAISRVAAGASHTVDELAACFLHLQQQGVHNLNLVTGSHYRPWILAALEQARGQGLSLPVVWNTGGYETRQAVSQLAPQVDVWLFDIKFYSGQLSAKLANAPDYFSVASQAAQLACQHTGPPVFDADGLLAKGVILRLLVLPGQCEDACKILQWMASALPKNGFLLSLMSQYTPPAGVMLPPPLGRRLASYEYRRVLAKAQSLGLENGYLQQRSSATEAYLPPFDTSVTN